MTNYSVVSKLLRSVNISFRRLHRVWKTGSVGSLEASQIGHCSQYAPSLEAVRGVRISEAYLDSGPLGSAQETPGHIAEHYTVLAHTGCIVLRSLKWRHAQGKMFSSKGDMMRSADVYSILNTRVLSPHNHTYSHPRSRGNPTMCHPKQSAVCNSWDKGGRGKLLPAGEHSLPPGRQK